MTKNKIHILAIIFFVIISFYNTSYATQEEILKEQSKNLNMNGFITEANEYTKDVFDGIDTKELLNSAIKGKIDNKTLINKVLNLFGDEIRQTLHILRWYCRNNCNS